MLDIASPTAVVEGSSKSETATAVCRSCKIRKWTICVGLTTDELREIATIADSIELGSGKGLFYSDDSASDAFIVTDGVLKTFKLMPDGRRQITGFMMPGDLLGLTEESRYAYSAEALTVAHLCRVDRVRLEDLLKRYPKMERRLLSLTRHEIAEAHEQMLLLGGKTPKEKIASFLISFRERAAARGLAVDPVQLPMNRAELGDFLGLTHETVSRTLSWLRKNEVIDVRGGGWVEIYDLKVLGKLAQSE